MYAVEFDAPIEKGRVVRIPKEFDRLGQIKTAKFIMMYSSDDMQAVDFKREDMQRMDSVDMIFDKYSIDMSQIKFNRDEAHER